MPNAKVLKTILRLNQLTPLYPRKKQKRIGRGDGSGHGGTSTRGHKGQKARAGGFHKRGFEGGQMPLSRRLPKRGFTNIFRVSIGIVNVEKLSTLSPGTEVTLTLAKEKGWVRNGSSKLKILGKGELKQPLVICADQISTSAKKKIEAAGGSFKSLL